MEQKLEIKKYINVSPKLRENYKSLRVNIDFCKNT